MLKRIPVRYLSPQDTQLINRGFAEMKTEDFTNIPSFNSIFLYPNLFFVIGYESEGIPLSFAACSVENGTCHVILCYTSVENRRKGWFKSLLANLREVDRSNPNYVWTKISFGVMKHNKVMKTVMRCVEANERAVYYEVKL